MPIAAVAMVILRALCIGNPPSPVLLNETRDPALRQTVN